MAVQFFIFLTKKVDDSIGFQWNKLIPLSKCRISCKLRKYRKVRILLHKSALPLPSM